MSDRRIVVTGMGTLNPLGNNVSETWEKLKTGTSGIKKIENFDASTFTCKIAGEIMNFDYKVHFSEEHMTKIKRLDRYVHFAGVAAKEAIAMSGIDCKTMGGRVGISIGSGLGGYNIQEQNTRIWADPQKGFKRVSPFYAVGFIGNTCSGFISIEEGIKGPNLAIQTACATANHSMAIACMIIKNEMADAMVVGGSEAAINNLGMAGFCNMKALSTKYNETPQKASRPFDVNRDGFVMGEGAGVLVLEEYEHAVKRGADILCEIAGFGMTGDAHDIVMPHPEGTGAYNSMKMAVNMADIKPSDIDYINTHGTSTPLGDVRECKAIYKLLDGDDSRVNVGSTKSMSGHLLGAASGFEAVASILSIKNQTIPPNVNLDEQDPDIPLTCLNTEPVETDVNIVLSNSFGFGGHNSTLVFKKID
jgi:3-oxoacyl-[acyl-carrier-protein] synthase II